jgi:SAM-dependent methyltransferase
VKTGPFEQYANAYDAWFERNPFAYQSELQAVAGMVPKRGLGIEIGVGTGRFAVPLGIKVGVEPSKAMGAIAQQRGIRVIRGAAESLPIADASFDFALMVTTLCFLDDVEASFRQTCRILKAGGTFILGFVDRESHFGRLYLKRKADSLFYREARFYSADEAACSMENAGFAELAYAQTIFQEIHRMQAPDPTRPGHGEGLFVVLKGTKPVEVRR